MTLTKKPEQLFEEINNRIHAGFGIVPLIGSGMSASSGIPAGSDYQAYLFYCLARVFGGDGTLPFGEAGREAIQAWDPRSFRWPPYSRVPVYDDLKKSMLDWSGKLHEQAKEVLGAASSRDCPLRKSKSKKHATAVAKWQAAGAVADWRATLNLLSRIKVDEDDEGVQHVRLMDPDPRIIDSFFVNLTQGKRANTAHMLLAHLADILRVKGILTTNFDNLIESAFLKLDMPIASFDVHYDTSFPDVRFVHAQRSVVKMHGSRYGLRADFTLDKTPHPHDADCFVSYLHQDTGDYQQRDLLVMGVSGAERRTISLICNALKVLSNRKRDLRVYWLCHRQDEVASVCRAFHDTLAELFLEDSRDGRDRSAVERTFVEASQMLESHLRVVVVPDLSLFLLGLFQNIFLCLPPSGVPFATVWPVPPQPYKHLDKDSSSSSSEEQTNFKTEIDRLSKEIIKVADKKVKSDSADNNKIAGLFVGGQGDVTSVASKVFTELSGPFHCIWLRLEETFDFADFFFLVFESLANESGVYGLPPVPFDRSSIEDRNEKYSILTSQLSRIVSMSTRRFLIFIDGRDYPGKSTDKHHYKEWCERTWQAKLFQAINRLQSPNVTFIITGWQDSFRNMIDTEERSRFKLYEIDRFYNDRQDEEVVDAVWNSIESIKSYAHDYIKQKNIDILSRERKETENLCGKLTNKVTPCRFRTFILGLTLFRYTCYRSALNSWALLKAPNPLGEEDNDRLRFLEANVYLDKLRELGAVRDEYGQGVFIHHSLSQKLDDKLTNKGAEMRFERAEGHQGIADWYAKLYRTSGDIHAAIESIQQRLKCIDAAVKVPPEEDRDNQIPRMLRSCVIETNVILELVGRRILSSSRPLTILRMFDRIAERLSYYLTNQDFEAGRKVLAKIDIKAGKTYTDALEEIDRSLKHLKRKYHAAIGDIKSAIQQDYEVSRKFRKVMPFQEKIDSIEEMVNDRKYDSAEKEICSLLNNDIQLDPQNIWMDKCRSNAGDWIHRKAAGDNSSHPDVRTAIKTLRFYQWLKIHRAQIARHNGDTEDAEKLLKQAEQIYIFATEIMRHIEDVNFLQRENAILRANSGVMLSWRKRHLEAHRRYNEAYGYLSHVASDSPRLEFAIVDMGRAETFIAQYEEQQDDNLSERCEGLLYDAVASVDRAAYKMNGTSVNTWWYGWLYELELSICHHIAKLEKKAAVPKKKKWYSHFRDSESLAEWFCISLNNGLHVIGGDILRLARFVTLTCEFEKNSVDLGACEEELSLLFKHAKKRLNNILQKQAAIKKHSKNFKHAKKRLNNILDGKLNENTDREVVKYARRASTMELP